MEHDLAKNFHFPALAGVSFEESFLEWDVEAITEEEGVSYKESIDESVTEEDRVSLEELFDAAVTEEDGFSLEESFDEAVTEEEGTSVEDGLEKVLYFICKKKTLVLYAIAYIWMQVSYFFAIVK